MPAENSRSVNDLSKPSPSPNTDILSETNVQRPASLPSSQKETENKAQLQIKDSRSNSMAKQALVLPSFYFKGKVTDENNKPIPYASIRIGNSFVGTYTDVLGNFSLVTSDSVINAEVVSVGYEKTNDARRPKRQMGYNTSFIRRFTKRGSR